MPSPWASPDAATQAAEFRKAHPEAFTAGPGKPVEMRFDPKLRVNVPAGLTSAGKTPLPRRRA